MTIFAISLTLLYAIAPSIYFIIEGYYLYSLIFILTAPVAFYIIAVILVCFIFLMLTFSKNKCSKFNYNLIRTVILFFQKAIYFYRVKAVNSLKEFKDKKVILIANHKSKLDPLFIIAVSKTPISFTPKKELYKNHFLKFIFIKLQAVQIDRNNIRKTVEFLKIAEKNIVEDKVKYMIFPEAGTQNREKEEIYNSKSAAYKLVLRSKAHIVGVAISNNLGFKKFYKKTLKVEFLDLIDFEEIKDFSTKQIGELIEPLVNKKIRAN